MTYIMAVTVIVAATFCLGGITAESDVSSYLYWRQADMAAWHHYFPLRALQQEQLTVEAAKEAVQSLASSLGSSLSRIVAFQEQELQSAQLIMAATDAEGCIRGIQSYMNDSISEAKATYSDCTTGALSKLVRLNTTLSKTWTSYQSTYSRALNGISVCAKTYPNKNSASRLMSCVDSMADSYFSAANDTINAVTPSPTMSYFKLVVLECASESANSVAVKGRQFLTMLTQCAVLDPNIDHRTYAEQLNKWSGYIDSLASQVARSQTQHDVQVSIVESDMLNYYNQLQRSMQLYLVESRGFSFYLSRGYRFLSSYSNTVTATALDYPADSTCIANATAALDSLANWTAVEQLSCDLKIVNVTKELISKVNSTFLKINDQLPLTGDVALLNCFSRGYVFAPSTISDCYNLAYSLFDLVLTEKLKEIASDVTVLVSYEQEFFSGSYLPCGHSSVQRVYWGGDVTLYDLQRCLYISFGTNYASDTTPMWYGYTTESTVSTDPSSYLN